MSETCNIQFWRQRSTIQVGTSLHGRDQRHWPQMSPSFSTRRGQFSAVPKVRAEYLAPLLQGYGIGSLEATISFQSISATILYRAIFEPKSPKASAATLSIGSTEKAKPTQLPEGRWLYTQIIRHTLLLYFGPRRVFF
jgi:hypothetical protein